MSIQAKLLCAVAVSGFAAFAATAPAQALTTQECSAKYQAAKTAGTLNGQKWNDSVSYTHLTLPTKRIV